MANVAKHNGRAARRERARRAATSSMAVIAPLAGWLLPGLGHLIQRRWIRGLLLMLAVFIMFFAGLGMQGKVYAFNTGDLLDILGFVGDIGAGRSTSSRAPWTGAPATSSAPWPTTAPSTSSSPGC